MRRACNHLSTTGDTIFPRPIKIKLQGFHVTILIEQYFLKREHDDSRNYRVL